MKRRTLNKIKKITMATAAFVCLASTAVLAAKFDAEANAKTVILSGRYYTNGTIVDSNGKQWDYAMETIEKDAWVARDGSVIITEISAREVENDIPVYIKVSDKGTEDISDDVILDVGYAFHEHMDEKIAETDRFIAEMDSYLARYK